MIFNVCVCVCGVEDLSARLRQRRLRWFGHIERMGNEVFVKKCMGTDEQTDGSST